MGSEEQLHSRIIEHLKSESYRPLKPRPLAKQLEVQEDSYHAFRDALKELMHEGRVLLGAGGTVVLPSSHQPHNEFVGSYRHNKRGFGFVVPTDPASHEDLYIPEGDNAGAITGDIVRARIKSRGHRDGKAIYAGQIVEIIERKNRRFAGTLNKMHGQWMVMPDGNALTEPILTPDAATRYIKIGTKVVVEITTFPEEGEKAIGVISEVLGEAGEKDVDLKSVIVQFNLPQPFEDAVRNQASEALASFDPESERARRIDLSDEVVCTIDPDDAKDYDDAISLHRRESGQIELGVHIADVSHFVPEGSPLDVEARERGNSSYFPGHVIPMLPEVLSNGVCSLQEAVPRLCKSAFITFDDNARPISTRFANTIITSAKRLRYREAQAILDGKQEIPHPDGPKDLSEYPPAVVKLLHEMNDLAKQIQARRRQDGQLVLELPDVELVLDEEGKVIDAVPEDASFTHTLIEMFMVEANEAVARLLDAHDVPFLRRIHPGPEAQDEERLKHFVQVSGYKLPKDMDRKALQALLETVKGRPESHAINLAILKSLSRAEYSPQTVGHFALASEHYCHFTSPIRRYADLTIHRLLDSYFEARDIAPKHRKGKLELDNVPSYDALVELGRHISFTERRSEDAERELRQVKLLELLSKQIGSEYPGVVTGITNFGIFIQISAYLIEGLIRYEDLMDDWWDVDARSGYVKGQRTGYKISMGNPITVRIVKVDVARRELELAVVTPAGKGQKLASKPAKKGKAKKGSGRSHPVQGKRPKGKAPRRRR